MAHTRRLGADDGTVLMACSICGNTFRYPTEIRFCPDRLFRCNRFCTETTTPLTESQKTGQGARIPDNPVPAFKVGQKPSWFT